MAGYVVTVFVSIIVALSLVGLGARFGYEFGACQVSTGYEMPRRHQISRRNGRVIITLLHGRATGRFAGGPFYF